VLFKELPSNIKKYRKKLGITQKELAKKICKSEISIRKYESGTVNIPPSTLFDICAALNVSVDELLGADSEEYRINNFEESLDLTLKQLGSLAEQFEKSFNIKDKTKKLDSSIFEDLNEEGIKEFIYSSIVDLMYLALNSTTLKYNIDSFSESELEEISNFIYSAYKLKVNEILERDKNKSNNK